MSVLADYLTTIRDVRSSGVSTPETSYYPAISNLLNAIGSGLKPKVICLINLKNQGAGLPDGGLFTADQLNRKNLSTDAGEPRSSTKPSRGAIEVKPPSDDLGDLAASDQVGRYSVAYRHVLITNLREFALVEQVDGRVHVLERFTLASSEADLWAKTNATAAELEVRFEGFLNRVLLTPAPLADPEVLARFLASYARDALVQVENAQVPGLTDVAANLEATLGVGFTGEAGQHFFNSTLIQTLFYGVFSAWVVWCRGNPRAEQRFSWKDTSELLHLSMLKVLFHEMTRPTSFFTHFLHDGLDLAEAALNRVDRATFFARFREDEAVLYFYEPFLEAFDPALRKELGVWYTPDEVVKYMVERCDLSLRNDLGIKDGFANPDVQILDPCCGTGAFLVAVLDRIKRTLDEQGEGALVPAQVARAVQERIIGFEILPAPYVISHLQVALYLQGLGVKLGNDERAAIYLTNALTGWVRPQGKQLKLLPELAEERDAADVIKRKTKVIVVIGNPPYNAFTGVQPAEEHESVEVYKKGLAETYDIRGRIHLDDLYVRFLRLAERKIVDQSKQGMVCLISNASYLADPCFAVLRERFMAEFDLITIDNLNGDSRETGKKTPDGKPDPSVFSTPRNREGIQVGTSIGHFVRNRKPSGKPTLAVVRWRDMWGESKRADLLANITKAPSYATVVPIKDSRWSFRPTTAHADYRAWASVDALCEHDAINGLNENRRLAMINSDKAVLIERMKAYYNASLTDVALAPLAGGLMEPAARFLPSKTRHKALAAEAYDERRLRRHAWLPMDTRWCYWSPVRPMWNEPRPALFAQQWEGNRFLAFRTAGRKQGVPVYMTTGMPDLHILDPAALAIPLRWRVDHLGATLVTANLSTEARAYLKTVGIANPDADEPSAAAIWYYILAISYSDAWLKENQSAIMANVPRMPLAAKSAVFKAGVDLGRRLADLLDPDCPVDGVTTGTIAPALRILGQICRDDGGAINESGDDLAVTAGWGANQAVKGGTKVMPRDGKTTPGTGAFINVHLNDHVFFANVPEAAWSYTIGGTKVLKKWLAYRERAVLGRNITIGEARHYVGMVRRLATIIQMTGALDQVYQQAKADSWRRDKSESNTTSNTHAKPKTDVAKPGIKPTKTAATTKKSL